jgi:hypothetical protein
VSSIDGLQALKEYNDWCEEADAFVSKVALTEGTQLSNIPRELADKTVTSLAKEIVRLHWLLDELLEELKTAHSAPAVNIDDVIIQLEDTYKNLSRHGY